MKPTPEKANQREALRAIRERFGLAQWQMAARVGVTPVCWVGLEREGRTPNRGTMALIRQTAPDLWPEIETALAIRKPFTMRPMVPVPVKAEATEAQGGPRPC